MLGATAMSAVSPASAPEASPAALGKPAPLDDVADPELSPVHDSPERKSLAASLASRTDSPVCQPSIIARSPSPEAGTARSQLRGKSVSLSGFHHPMCNGKYALASTFRGKSHTPQPPPQLDFQGFF